MINLTPSLQNVVVEHRAAYATKRIISDIRLAPDQRKRLQAAEDALLNALELAYGPPPWRRQAWTCDGFAVVYRPQRTVRERAFIVVPLAGTVVKELESNE